MSTKGQKKEHLSQQSITDDRFARVQYDPSFKSMKKSDKKVKIDKRFAGVFTEKRFKTIAKSDKYGNAIEVEEGRNKEMDEFYYDDEEEVEQSQDSNQEEEEVVAKPKKASKKEKKAAAEVVAEAPKKSKKKAVPVEEEVEDSGEDDSDLSGSFQWDEVSSSDEELEFDDEQELQEEYHYGVEKVAAPVGDKTSSKLALLNYDWQSISASDIMLLFNSFKDKLGVITSVTVYPSDFGLKMLAQDNLQGPQDIWKDQNQQEVEHPEAAEKPTEGKNEESKLKLEKSKKKQREQKNRLFESKRAGFLNHTVVVKIDDEQSDLDPVKLREYERQRMRYFYAVIECDCKKTAEKIYEQCDGMDFEMSGIQIDLRFVPEDQVFPHEPKEVCDEVPADSKVKSFVNRSIGHTNTRLTWDQPEDRFKFMDGKMTEKDLEKIDWSKYIAPSEEAADFNEEDELREDILEEEEEEADLDSDEEIAALEREALREEQSINNINWKSSFDKRSKTSKRDDEIEVRFRQGFDTIGNRILDKQQSKNETIYETRERHRKEKRHIHKQEMKDQTKKHRDNKKNLGGGGDDESKLTAPEKALQKAQLELLIEQETKKPATVTLDDPRFSAIYKTNDYAIDPTSKFYNKDHSKKVLDEQIKQRKIRKLNEEEGKN